jgi:hypothetical protein
MLRQQRAQIAAATDQQLGVCARRPVPRMLTAAMTSAAHERGRSAPVAELEHWTERRDWPSMYPAGRQRTEGWSTARLVIYPQPEWPCSFDCYKRRGPGMTLQATRTIATGDGWARTDGGIYLPDWADLGTRHADAASQPLAIERWWLLAGLQAGGLARHRRRRVRHRRCSHLRLQPRLAAHPDYSGGAFSVVLCAVCAAKYG